MGTGLKTQRQKIKRQKTSGKQRRRPRYKRGERPTIRFTPFAWSKLLFLRDCGSTEVSGFGITAKNDLLLVEDLRVWWLSNAPRPVFSSAIPPFRLFDDTSHAQHRDRNSGCIWIHTHPGDCALPSDADEHTFAHCCSTVNWAVMFIIAANGDTYARLQFNLGPGCSRRLSVDVDYSGEFRPSDFAAWQAEYNAHVEIIDPLHATTDRHCACSRRSQSPDLHTGLQDPHVRAAITSEWLAHCDAIALFEDDVEVRQRSHVKLQNLPPPCDNRRGSITTAVELRLIFRNWHCE